MHDDEETKELERLLASHAFLRGASPEEIDALEAALVKRKSRSPTHDVTVKVSKRQPQQQTVAEVSVDFAHGRDPRVAPPHLSKNRDFLARLDAETTTDESQ